MEKDPSANLPAATIAVVDDDPSVRKALHRLFRTAGFQVLLYGSALEFLEAVKTISPGCAVIDIHMPGMSGLDLHHLLILFGSAMPVIIITAHDSLANREAARKNGAVAYFLKPFENDELMVAVRQALATVGYAP